MNSSPRPDFLYLGHSTVLCTLPSGKTILIDPWVDHNPACPAAAKSLPRVDPAEVFGLARSDLAASAEYVHALQRASAPRGLVEFTALPVLLARATLDRVETAGAGAKLSRPEVAAIVEGMRRELDSERPAIPA